MGKSLTCFHLFSTNLSKTNFAKAHLLPSLIFPLLLRHPLRPELYFQRSFIVASLPVLLHFAVSFCIILGLLWSLAIFWLSITSHLSTKHRDTRHSVEYKEQRDHLKFLPGDFCRFRSTYNHPIRFSFHGAFRCFSVAFLAISFFATLVEHIVTGFCQNFPLASRCPLFLAFCFDFPFAFYRLLCGLVHRALRRPFCVSFLGFGIYFKPQCLPFSELHSSRISLRILEPFLCSFSQSFCSAITVLGVLFPVLFVLLSIKLST